MNEKEYYFSTEQMSNGITLCLENASNLIEEAGILFNKKKYARTLSLAILSLEELGKIVLLTESVSFTKNRNDRIKEFFKDFRSHITKRKDSIIPLYVELYNIGLSKGNEIEKIAKRAVKTYKSLMSTVDKLPTKIKNILLEEKNVDVEELKLMGFYVDYNGSEFTSPDIIDKEIAFYFLHLSEQMLKKYDKYWSKEKEELSKTLKMMRDENIIKPFVSKYISYMKVFYKEMGIDMSDDYIKKLKDYIGYKK